jgi:hypothetical protein
MSPGSNAALWLLPAQVVSARQCWGPVSRCFRRPLGARSSPLARRNLIWTQSPCAPRSLNGRSRYGPAAVSLAPAWPRAARASVILHSCRRSNLHLIVSASLTKLRSGLPTLAGGIIPGSCTGRALFMSRQSIAISVVCLETAGHPRHEQHCGIAVERLGVLRRSLVFRCSGSGRIMRALPQPYRSCGAALLRR